MSLLADPAPRHMRFERLEKRVGSVTYEASCVSYSSVGGTSKV